MKIPFGPMNFEVLQENEYHAFTPCHRRPECRNLLPDPDGPRWYYLFDRHNRWQILAESLRYCQEHKGLELNGFVFMLNHIHLIATSPDMAGFLRDFKRFTSVKFKGNLKSTEPSVLKLFLDEDGKYRFWMDANAPKKIENPGFYRQNLNYIHENPVRKGYVARPKRWVWLSANSASKLGVRFLDG